MNQKELISIIRTEILLAKSIPERKGYIAGLEEAINIIEGFSDEPQAGHAEEAPRYVRNVIARLRELPLHNREVWLKAIMSEFEQDFSHAKWREGYEQGKFEGEWVGNQLKDADKIRQELNKPVIPQFVADWIEYCKYHNFTLFGCFDPVKDFERLAGETFEGDARKCIGWCRRASDKIARAWLDGYEVKEEKRYTVKIKTYLGQFLGRYYLNDEELTPQFTRSQLTGKGELPTFTRQELEETGFGWVFDCEGIEVEEVEE